MPCYNYETYVQEALESLQAQSYTHWEVIVCDDGSTDGSVDVVREIGDKDERIKLLTQPNQGVGAALNHAFRACNGDVVCLLDADDIFATGKLQRIVEEMQSQSQAGFVQHAMEVIDHSGKQFRALPAHGLYEEGWIAERVLARGGRWRNMPASALSFRREIADILFPMPAEQLRSMADAYLYMLAPLLTEVAYLDQPLSSYRLHGANLTGARHIDKKIAQQYTAGITRVHNCIKAVVETRISHLPIFDLSRHLTFQEHAFLSMLFDNTPRSKLKEALTSLSKQIQKDDLYPSQRKLQGRLLFASAIFLPRSWREKWVSKWMGGSG